MCDKFMEATLAAEHCLARTSDAGASTPSALDDFVDNGTRRARAASQRIGTMSGALPFSVEDAIGYSIDFLEDEVGGCPPPPAEICTRATGAV